MERERGRIGNEGDNTVRQTKCWHDNSEFVETTIQIQERFFIDLEGRHIEDTFTHHDAVHLFGRNKKTEEERGGRLTYLLLHVADEME